MTWVKLDDHFPDHPKVDNLSDGAFRLHVAALCYSARLLSDGFVPAERVPRLVPRFRKGYAGELVAAGVWQPAEGGWSIHDYLAYNPSRSKVLADREAAADRAARSRGRARARAVERAPAPSRPEGSRDGECPSSGEAAVPATDPPLPTPMPDGVRALLARRSG